MRGLGLMRTILRVRERYSAALSSPCAARSRMSAVTAASEAISECAVDPAFAATEHTPDPR